MRILYRLSQGETLSTNEKQALANIDWEIDISLETRIYYFPIMFEKISPLAEKEGLKQDQILGLLWNLWLPIALKIARKKEQKKKPFIQGILGLQGTGKTTLAIILQGILTQFGYHTVTLSLDDLYKTYPERQQLQKEDPRLILRGPPETHDVNLGKNLLENLLQEKTPLEIPRFDKSACQGSGDRATPETINDKIDILLFEGWFLGVKPIAETAFTNPPSPIDTEADRQFALDNNRRLQSYLPLWEYLDSLMILVPEDYHLSEKWRQEAEQKMIAQGKSGMSNAEIKQFVEYFWKALHPELFITPLIESKQGVDLVVEIDANHVPRQVY
ncbi:glycerate kinase [Euhalothece natronophila Z-M001]|uniref:Glycerate kinase n=1 Tax=Euhalothece natronophila Z-M001 TaxID=522448 RepID=A0A5B8NIJ1_9CHRO|nr:glycerate kinase [Euhalothece natronophila]QDZ38774.1 glycerate kinase [Euhalothece natronophila Z-M001]